MSREIENVLAALDGFRMCDQMDYAAYSALHDMISVLDVPGWISVKDRLPDKGQTVIVCDGKHTWDVGQYKGLCYTPGRTETNPRKEFWEWKKNTVKIVWWWMPKDGALPEPPKEGANAIEEDHGV